MHPSIQGLGWFARRTPVSPPTIAFYRDVVGLPFLRGREDMSLPEEERNRSGMFWAGETAVLWVSPGGTDAPDYTDRAQAPLIPVFRCYDMQPLVDRVAAAGSPIVNEIEMAGRRVVYFKDPSGNITGVQEVPPGSPFGLDNATRARWEAGRPSVAGIAPLPAEIQQIGWVIQRTPEREKATAFYRDVMGLEVAATMPHATLLKLGEDTTYEIADGGETPALPTDRKEVNNAMILRVHAIDDLVAKLKAAGVHFVNDRFEGSGHLAYFVDPVGQLVGLQERLADTPRPEDQEATRRWEAARA